MKVKTLVHILERMPQNQTIEFCVEGQLGRSFIEFERLQKLEEIRVEDCDLSGQPYEHDIVERLPAACRIVFNS